MSSSSVVVKLSYRTLSEIAALYPGFATREMEIGSVSLLRGIELYEYVESKAETGQSIYSL